jgi:hypothetical protein
MEGYLGLICAEEDVQVSLGSATSPWRADELKQLQIPFYSSHLWHTPTVSLCAGERKM